MNWFKQNYDRLFLMLAALALAASAGVLFTKAQDFNRLLPSLNRPIAQEFTDPSLDLPALMAASMKIDNPDIWRKRTIDDQELPLFVSPPILELPSKKPFSFEDC